MDAERLETDEWCELQRNLEAAIPVYDRVNRWATFGADQRWRRRIRRMLPPGGAVLEIGCGPGTFAEAIEGPGDLVLVDPIPAMLEVARSRVDPVRATRGQSPATYVEATAESLPLEDQRFDAVCCLFSFRDFVDKADGLAEILRVLKPGGQLIILDAGKLNRVHGWGGSLWMRTWVSWGARRAFGSKDHPWRWLAHTYDGFGTVGSYRRMLREVGFTDVRGRVVTPMGMFSLWRAGRVEVGDAAAE